MFKQDFVMNSSLAWDQYWLGALTLLGEKLICIGDITVTLS